MGQVDRVGRLTAYIRVRKGHDMELGILEYARKYTGERGIRGIVGPQPEDSAVVEFFGKSQ